MAALAAPVLKPGLFQVGYQLANLARHFSINLVSQLFKTVKQLNLAVTTRKNCSIPGAGHLTIQGAIVAANRNSNGFNQSARYGPMPSGCAG
jgi:hypothetical protein